MYNNFYEFGSHKQIASAAQALKIRPWEVQIDGLCDNPQTIGIDDLLKKVSLEETALSVALRRGMGDGGAVDGLSAGGTGAACGPQGGGRNTCAWKPSSTRTRPAASVPPGTPWPYVEGLTIAEATNELAFLVTGVYGKPLAKQFGAPLRLAVPWKYGFKSIKSITRFSFTEERPVSFWEGGTGGRIRLLGECEPGGSPPALEPGERAVAAERQPRADAALQRLRRLLSPTSTRGWRARSSTCEGGGEASWRSALPVSCSRRQSAMTRVLALAVACFPVERPALRQALDDKHQLCFPTGKPCCLGRAFRHVRLVPLKAGQQVALSSGFAATAAWNRHPWEVSRSIHRPIRSIKAVSAASWLAGRSVKTWSR